MILYDMRNMYMELHWSQVQWLFECIYMKLWNNDIPNILDNLKVAAEDPIYAKPSKSVIHTQPSQSILSVNQWYNVQFG